MTHQLLCLGCGYTAERVADRMRAAGWRTSGTSRDAARRDQLIARGHAAIDPADDQAMARALSEATHILAAAAPRHGGDPFIARAGEILPQRSNAPIWLGYLSTTGVYGIKDGSWADEETPPAPLSARGQARVEAENAWRRLADDIGAPAAIFRLAGIYGPGRNVLAQLKAGTARRIVKDGQVFNRAHVDDIAAVVAAAMTQPARAGIYNVADDEASSSADVIAYGAELLGLPMPPATPFETADLSPMAREFYAENKRIRNDKIKDQLGVTLAYPDYRAGLKALLDQI